jgi:methionyl-tRNA synthetase
LAKINPYEDSDFTIEKFEEAYNADLANGLGNLVARVAKLCETNNLSIEKTKTDIYERVKNSLANYRFDLTLYAIWARISQLDQEINIKQPWGKKGKELEQILKPIIFEIQKIAFNLKPFLPETAEKIEEQFKGSKIKSGEPLFPRLS